MNSDTLIRKLAEADVYAPDHDLPETARASTVALTEIRRRIDMEAKELTRPVTPDRSPRRGWLVAVAAAAAVIVIVGAVVLLTGSSDDVAPATTPSTTMADTAPTTTQAATTTVPLLDAQSVAFVEALVSDINGGDHESAGARIDGVGEINKNGYIPGVEEDDWTPFFKGMYEYWTLVGSRLSIDECRTLQTSGITRCALTRQSDEAFTTAPEEMVVQVRVDDGQLTYFEQGPNVAGQYWRDSLAFDEWLYESTFARDTSVYNAWFSFASPAERAAVDREYGSAWADAGRPTTSELTDRDAAFVAEYERIVSSGDRDAFVALFAPGAGRLWSAENPIVIKAERLADEMLGLRARETVTSFDECRSIGSSVRCTVEFSGPVEQALYGSPLSGPYSFLLTDDGLIEEIRGNDGSFAPALEAGGRFMSWMRDEHPDVYAQMVPIGNRELLAESDAELWLEWAPRWAEAGRP